MVRDEEIHALSRFSRYPFWKEWAWVGLVDSDDKTDGRVLEGALTCEIKVHCTLHCSEPSSPSLNVWTYWRCLPCEVLGAYMGLCVCAGRLESLLRMWFWRCWFSLKILVISFRFHTGLWFQVSPTSPSLVACRKLVPNSRRFLSWTDTTNQKTVRSTQRWILFPVLQHPEAALLVAALRYFQIVHPYLERSSRW